MKDDLFKWAQQQAEEGMERALSHAERKSENWGAHALAFLIQFARTHEVFISEDVSDASKLDESFPQPPTDRAWGSVYQKAIKQGVMVRFGEGKSRRRHASICPRWRSLL